MAAVHSGVTDFVPFSNQSAEPTYPETPFQTPNNTEQTLDHCFSMAGTRGRQGYPEQGITSYDSYGSGPSYSIGPSSYFQAPQQPFTSTKSMASCSGRRPTPSTSPSSFSQPYDQAPSVMSSASGASGQSTNSSTDGSPHAPILQHLPHQEKWSESLHGLGLGPTIVSGDQLGQESYPIHDLEQDLNLDDHKSQHFVGKYPTTSSIVFSANVATVPSLLSDLFPQEYIPTLFSSPLALEDPVSLKPFTVDSNLDEVDCETTAPTRMHYPMPEATSVLRSVRSTSLPPKPVEALITSPLTPASTSLPYPSKATALGAQKESEPIPQESSLRPNSQNRGQIYFHFSQDPSFGQSSGRFVAPIESSCSFS